jgi:chromosome segregation ATPase
MFISKSEKLKINERLEAMDVSLTNLSEAFSRTQEDIPNIKKTLKGFKDTFWDLNAKLVHTNEEIRALQKSVSSLQTMNDLLTKNNKSLFASVANLASRIPLSRPLQKFVIAPESVQELKESGVWEDPTKRIKFIDHLIKDEQEKRAKEKKERQRESSRKYYLLKKAKKLAQATT